MSDKLISVIIPVYNTAHYLDRCIRSVVENTYKYLEIICVNDGSTDNSLEILNRLAQTDNRIRIIDQPNGGVSAARNHGLDMAKGDYVAFVDSDDWVHQEYFSCLYSVAEENQTDLVACGYAQVFEYDDEQRKKQLTHKEDTKVHPSEMSRGGNLTYSPWSKLYRRSTIAHLRFPININYGEDQIFNVQLFASQDDLCIHRIDLPLYYYFDRPNSLVHNSDSKRLLQIAEYYLDHLQGYYRRDIPLSHLCRTLYSYRYEASIVGNKNEARRRFNHAFRRVIPWLLREKHLTPGKKIRYLVAASSAGLYRAQILAKDPTFRDFENALKERAKNGSEM